MAVDPIYQLNIKSVEGKTYRETTRDGIKPDMDLMNEIGRLRYTHQGTPRVDIFHPAINLLVRPESEI